MASTLSSLFLGKTKELDKELDSLFKSAVSKLLLLVSRMKAHSSLDAAEAHIYPFQQAYRLKRIVWQRRRQKT
jgi:hypothetical protein